MAMIIKHYVQPRLNPLNFWPSNGLFTQCEEDVVSRHWFYIFIDELPTLIGNVFELSNEMILMVSISARPNYDQSQSPYIDVCIQNVRQQVMPLEPIERQSLVNYLNKTTHRKLLVSDVTQVVIGCHANGWF